MPPPRWPGPNTAATTTALLGLHLVPAAVMIPTLARSLRPARKLAGRARTLRDAGTRGSTATPGR
jgi:hypothetical protein